jgi:UDP-N-acetylglucosamine acyltransferase
MVTERNDVNGLNRVGLKRLEFEAEIIKDLKACYRAVYSGGMNLRNLAAEARANAELGTGELGKQFLEFFEAGKRGFARPNNG